MIILTWWAYLAAIPIAALGIGRLTRLIVHETFPPMAKIRAFWDNATDKSDWNLLFHCHWCMSFWVTVGCALWFFIGMWVFWIAVAWFIFFGLFALAYLAGMIVERDEQE